MDATHMTPESLDSIMQRHGSDKASVFTRTYAKPKDYCRHYEQFFAPLRDQPVKFLEIGVGGGESIRGWLDYFPNAQVFGVDIVHDTNPWDSPGTMHHPRYRFVTADQSSDVFWQCFIADFHGDWDVICDDGGHASNQIITSFNHLWPVVKPGGLYIVEDLGVAYGDGSFVPAGWPNHMAWLKTLVDGMNIGSGDIDSIYFSRELAVLRKAKA